MIDDLKLPLQMEHFLWGGLQRREDEETYPYGIYGSDYWFDNRNSTVMVLS